MKGPNKLITLVFFGALIYGIIQILPYIKKNKVAAVPQITSETKIKETETDKTPAQTPVQESPEDKLKKQERLKILTWNRNPFIISENADIYKKFKRSGEQEAQTEGAETAGKEKLPIEIKLSAIMTTGQQKVATIGREPYIVKIGDLIETEKVLDIKNDRIIIGKEGTTREIYLEAEGLGK